MSNPSLRPSVMMPLSREDAERRAAQLGVVADPTRLRLMSLVLTHPAGEASVGQLAAEFTQSPTAISQQLRLLCEADLLTRERRQSSNYYRPTHHAVEQLATLLGVETPEQGPARESTVDLSAAVVDRQLERISDQLATRFTGVFSPATVRRYVGESYTMLADRSRVRRFLPSLTASFAAERLAALAKAQGKARGSVPEVLFVCVRNAGRSQMAAGFLNQLAGDRVLVRSAGSLPVALVDANVVTAMDEVGVHLGGAYPKPLSDEIVRAADVVVTMGCGDACPVYPGKRYLDWPVEDPENRPLPVVRRIRDEIDQQVRDLAAELLTPA
ncbi:three-helix bundle dimerization domain-containing protein [Kribbella italica]|uniref:Protein-tyrosine-phosphatase/DNA-binding MarR family transcriptional regulator n=1 Tax=Kribbella italica TaxID=1540520 RepID=A0A7W9JE94_9ACTN|nr:ArsR family transcriptional regulator [Kribbella italica]MBB5840547.1 protein-tyrosine-phosphatase/DNA-binding MarR family transcriptional regulator [Kribbella italica]